MIKQKKTSFFYSSEISFKINPGRLKKQTHIADWKSS